MTTIRKLTVSALAVLLAACFTESKHIAADASYEAQQMACVDNNKTRTNIDRCRQNVKLAWTIDAGPSPRTLNFGNDNDAGDAGKDATHE